MHTKPIYTRIRDLRAEKELTQTELDLCSFRKGWHRTAAGVARFELTNEGVKVPCLTAWLHPKIMQTLF